MSDSISRQGAIDVIHDVYEKQSEFMIPDMIKGIESLPSTDRPIGKWIVKHGSHAHIRTSWYACNKCGGAGDISDKYCKHCGAKMEDEK